MESSKTIVPVLKVRLILSKAGDNIRLEVCHQGEKRPVCYEKDNIHSVLKSAQHCSDYSKVLTLLINLRDIYELKDFAELHHENNSHYDEHRSLTMFTVNMRPGTTHVDTLEKLIEFVQERQAEVPRQSCNCLII